MPVNIMNVFYKWLQTDKHTITRHITQVQCRETNVHEFSICIQNESHMILCMTIDTTYMHRFFFFY